MSLLVGAAVLLGVATTIAALMPAYLWFAIMLIPVGLTSMTFLNLCNTIVQLNTAAQYRGRVLALYMAVIQGGTPIGAPIIGWIANAGGARWSIAVGGLAALVAGILGVVALTRWGEGTLREQLLAVWAARRDEAEAATSEMAVGVPETRDGASSPQAVGVPEAVGVPATVRVPDTASAAGGPECTNARPGRPRTVSVQRNPTGSIPRVPAPRDRSERLRRA
jgi:MFS family permease